VKSTALTKAGAEGLIAQVLAAAMPGVAKEVRQAYADGAAQSRLMLDASTGTIVKLHEMMQSLHGEISGCFDRLGKVAELSAGREIFLAEKEIMIKRLEQENKRAEKIVEIFAPVVKEVSARYFDKQMPEKLRKGKDALETLFLKLLAPENAALKQGIEGLAGKDDWAAIMTLVEALTS
jgi:hypothetical protein